MIRHAFVIGTMNGRLVEDDRCHVCLLPRSAAAHDPEPKPLINRDEAKKRVECIVSDIQDRRGFHSLWYDLDKDVRDEIVESWVQIVITGTRR